VNTTDRHPDTIHVVQFFDSDHLPPNLRAVSKPCEDLAEAMLLRIPDGPELTAGLRHLLEAKDCFVRAAVLSAKSGRGSDQWVRDAEAVLDAAAADNVRGRARS
jgi:hypothetical protein